MRARAAPAAVVVSRNSRRVREGRLMRIMLLEEVAGRALRIPPFAMRLQRMGHPGSYIAKSTRR